MFQELQIITQPHPAFFSTITHPMTHKLNTTLIFTLFLSLQLSAQQATLLYDINPGFATGIQSDAAALAGGKYFFHGKTAAEGQELSFH
jgi:hypothetical protein